MKLVLVLAGMGKHSAPSRFETLLPSTRGLLRGQVAPLVAIALVGAGVAWAFNEGVQSALDDQQPGAKKGFIYACSGQLCQDSVVFTPSLKIACKKALDDPRIIIDEAIHKGENTIEIGSFLTPVPGKMDAVLTEALKKVDRTISEARKNNIRIILNLSNLVVRHATDKNQAAATEWKNLIETTSKHINTETGVIYADDPTIMMIKLRPATECTDEPGTSSYTLEPRVAKLARAAFPNQLVES